MYEVIKHEKKMEWTDIGIEGVHIKILHENEKSKALTVITKMEAGSEIPKHFHSKADEIVYVLSGEFIENGKVYGIGNIFFGTAKTEHGPHKTTKGCLLLTNFSSELDFNIVI